jgi:preprotein translocase subunit SecE
MNSNRRWIALAFFIAGMILWVITSKFLITAMMWTGTDRFDYNLIGDRFTLTTLVGLAVALWVSIWSYRHPTISTLSNEVVVELKKVTWPSALETRSATVVVIVTVFIMSVFLGLFDLFWSRFLDFLYPRIQSG